MGTAVTVKPLNNVVEPQRTAVVLSDVFNRVG
jgi:hypothetical protein